MNWLNIYPLIKDPAFLKMSSQEDLMSLWIPVNKIAAISFGKKARGGNYVIEVVFNDTAKTFEQEFEEFDDAREVWQSVQMSLGIKVPKKRGPKPRFFENLKSEE